MQLSSSSFFRLGGSSRQPAVSSSRDPAITGGDPDPRTRGTDAGAEAPHKMPSSAAQRISPVVPSDHKRNATSRNANSKNLDSTLKGIEGLSFSNDERLPH